MSLWQGCRGLIIDRRCPWIKGPSFRSIKESVCESYISLHYEITYLFLSFLLCLLILLSLSLGRPARLLYKGGHLGVINDIISNFALSLPILLFLRLRRVVGHIVAIGLGLRVVKMIIGEEIPSVMGIIIRLYPIIKRRLKAGPDLALNK